MSNTVTVHISADGAYPELARRDQVRGLLTSIGGMKRLNGPPAAILVGRTKHGRPVALEVNMATLAVAVDQLRRAHGIDFGDVDVEQAPPAPKAAV